MDMWNGFRKQMYVIDGREAVVVFPDTEPNGRWALKTEYFDAFPDVQISLLKKGYHIAYISTRTRWYVPEDNVSKAKLAEFMNSELGLAQKCVIIGMSCGGMQGIYFADEYPQYVSCMYLDAPVVNFLSCPFGVGMSFSDFSEEFVAHTGKTLSDMLAYRDHPLDRLPSLVKKNIPLFLVSGDSDSIVPFRDNGYYIEKIYRDNCGVIESVIKPGGDHHPHSLPDNTPILEFINKYDLD